MPNTNITKYVPKNLALGKPKPSRLIPGTRPQLLSEEVVSKVCESLRLGCYIETAAVQAGIYKSTLHAWIAAGRSDSASDEMREFIARIDEAMAQAEVLALQRVVGADEWQSAAWRLERRYPEKWGRVDRLKAEHTGKDGAQLVVFAIT